MSKYTKSMKNYYFKNKNNPEFIAKQKKRSKEYYIKNKITINKKCKDYYNTVRKPRQHSEWVAYKYGITQEDYDRMFDNQKGCCAICGIHQSKLKQKLHVDHCHNTGKVRKLLCRNCNIHLGWYEKWTQNIKNYLKNS